jgi:hypothetical protein
MATTVSGKVGWQLPRNGPFQESRRRVIGTRAPVAQRAPSSGLRGALTVYGRPGLVCYRSCCQLVADFVRLQIKHRMHRDRS